MKRKKKVLFLSSLLCVLIVFSGCSSANNSSKRFIDDKLVGVWNLSSTQYSGNVYVDLAMLSFGTDGSIIIQMKGSNESEPTYISGTYEVDNDGYIYVKKESGAKDAKENLMYMYEFSGDQLVFYYADDASVLLDKNTSSTNPRSTPSTTIQPTPEPTTTMTIGQKNALNTAKDYLAYSAFSYTGLIKQLEYEQYSTEDATFAVDNCGADWNKQAAKSAQDYLDYSSFSRDGLISQLEYEGFTPEQAEYGVTAVGY